MNEEQLKQLEATFKAAAEKVINENMKGVVDPWSSRRLKPCSISCPSKPWSM